MGLGPEHLAYRLLISIPGLVITKHLLSGYTSCFKEFVG